MSLILVNEEAAHALKFGGPTDKQLIKMLNSNEEKDMPSSRHVRWMAGFILVSEGHTLNRAPEPKN